MKNIFLYITFLVFWLLGQNSVAQRVGSWNENWKTIKTRHFDVIYNAKQPDLGRHYANVAEKAYSNLSNVFSKSTERIVLIVNDTTDIANGYATRIPYPHIMAYSVVAGDHDSLSESGDWASILVTHELTHILQFEPAGGFYRYLRPVFGNIIAPNLLMPSWWKEGMAVELETRFSNSGRLRSTYQDAAVRSIVLDNKISEYGIDQANETLPSWPYGLRPYLFGSLFFSQLFEETKDLKSIDFLSNRQGERVPYFIEKPIRELTGDDYQSVYLRGLAQAEKNARTDLDVLNKAELTPKEVLDPESQGNQRPSISEKLGLLAYVENFEDESRIVIKSLKNEKIKFKSLPKGSIQNISFHPTEPKILYSKTDLVDSKHNYSDLHEYNLKTFENKKLTTSARARSPVYSSNGKKILFISTNAGRTQIKILDKLRQKTEMILESNFVERYDSTLFWDDKTILAVKIDQDGNYKLYKIDLIEKTEIAVDLSISNPRFLLKKNESLYFVSDQSGVNNVYETVDLINAKPITHVLTGIWSFDLTSDKKTLYGSTMTSEGFKIVRYNLNKPVSELPEIENKIASRYKKYTDEQKETPLTEEEYKPGTYLWPSYWIPFISTGTASNGIFVQAQTDGFDPLKIHQYAIVASYDSELEKGNFSGSYINSQFATPFKVSSVLRSFALGSYNNVVQRTTHSFSILPDLFKVHKSLTLDLGLLDQETEFGIRTGHYGPFAEISFLDYNRNIFDISPETGWSANLRLEHLILSRKTNDSGFAAKDFDRLQFALQKFWRTDSMPKHHAVKLRAAGQMTFQSVSSIYGISSASTFFEEDGYLPQLVNRGYAPAQFYGRNIWNTNFEYRFPLWRIDSGNGTDPYFFKRVSGALVYDALGADGFGLDRNLNYVPIKSSKIIGATGAELKIESTIGYILPINFILGLYKSHSEEFNPDGNFAFSLQIGKLF
jgi:hypothetical protein